MQRQAACFCKREYSREEGTVTRILNELEWESLEDRREIKKVTMFYKISQGLVDIVASDHLVQQFNKGTRGRNIARSDIGLVAMGTHFFLQLFQYGITFHRQLSMPPHQKGLRKQ